MLLVVFRPVQLPKYGFLYGWNISDDAICIAGALASSSHEHAIDALAKALSEWYTTLDDDLDSKPQVLGHIAEHNRLVLDRQFVGTILFIEYCPPNTRRMQFFSLEPLELDITPNILNSVSSTAYERALFLREYTVSIEPQKWLRVSLSISLKYLNKAYELRRIVAVRRDNCSLLLWAHSFNTHIRQLVITSFKIMTASHYFHSLLPFFRFLWSKPLRDRSAFGMVPKYSYENLMNPHLFLHWVLNLVQQLDVRKDLLLFVFKQICTLEKGETDDLHFISIQHISLYNCIWLTLNDIIIGTACGIFLIENHRLLSFILYKIINKVIITYMRNTVAWLDNWPAGLKLNTELSRALFHSFIQVTCIMEAILDRMAPYFPALLQFAGIMGRFGLTMSLALFSDYLSILTGHLYMLHLVTTLMFSQLKSMFGSLWNLFRGKRFNVLRQRNDFREYDVDQLLLGTILMTLIVFLSPTVLMYYMLFALARFGIMGFHAVLDTCLALLNHFPLFALMLRIKEPHRLPGGIQFKTAATLDSLVIENQVIPLSKIFFQHSTYDTNILSPFEAKQYTKVVLWSRLSSHYDPRRLLTCILRGMPMIQLPREDIRYNFVKKQAVKLR